MTYSVTYEGVIFTIPFNHINFNQSSFGLEAVVQGEKPSITLKNTLELMQERGLIASLNLHDDWFAFWIVEGIVK